jgi:hypothetical protein
MDLACLLTVFEAAIIPKKVVNIGIRKMDDRLSAFFLNMGKHRPHCCRLALTKRLILLVVAFSDVAIRA